jgi:hypothetical protein
MHQQNKCDDTKDRFYEELEHEFNQLPKYHIEFNEITMQRWGEKIFSSDIWE